MRTTGWFTTKPRRRHYHVEDIDGTLYRPLASFREARSLAFSLVKHARLAIPERHWFVSWTDPEAGYHRWTGYWDGKVGLTDTINIVPCPGKADRCTTKWSDA